VNSGGRFGAPKLESSKDGEREIFTSQILVANLSCSGSCCSASVSSRTIAHRSFRPDGSDRIRPSGQYHRPASVVGVNRRLPRSTRRASHTGQWPCPRIVLSRLADALKGRTRLRSIGFDAIFQRSRKERRGRRRRHQSEARATGPYRELDQRCPRSQRTTKHLRTR